MKKDYKELTRQAYIDAYRYEVKNTAYDCIDDEYFYVEYLKKLNEQANALNYLRKTSP